MPFHKMQNLFARVREHWFFYRTFIWILILSAPLPTPAGVILFVFAIFNHPKEIFKEIFLIGSKGVQDLLIFFFNTDWSHLISRVLFNFFTEILATNAAGCIFDCGWFLYMGRSRNIP